ncbi:cupin domain-containing protein [Maribellus maritimus]|uniref:cupin domain-containing protein n=1 Tax=Maribellus maritimus TaxID=2870838 RepID=UPI001EEBC3BC|nr:cupin domain-containing protein [Maribellus maritimus]MCG6191535.1 cupin domain-containing protein [Maribellus maritimus]
MQDTEIEKSKQHILIEIIDYTSNSVTSKTIIEKTTGSVNILAFDSRKILPETVSAFDVFILIIEGDAEIIIDKYSNPLKTGEGIIVPAHTSHLIKANKRFKMISTVIKSGYEEIIL